MSGRQYAGWDSADITVIGVVESTLRIPAMHPSAAVPFPIIV